VRVKVLKNKALAGGLCALTLVLALCYDARHLFPSVMGARECDHQESPWEMLGSRIREGPPSAGGLRNNVWESWELDPHHVGLRTAEEEKR
jgi:hypothetical protein